MSYRIDDSELLDIAKTSEHARVLRKALQQLAESGFSEVLREMAEDVLSGRAGLREAEAEGF